MDAFLILALTGAAAVNAAAPGPCILVASSRAATDGIWSGFRVTLGVAIAKASLIALCWAVLVGVFRLSSAAQEVLRMGGLAVLVMLALAMLAAPEETRTGLPVIGRLHLGDAALGLALGLSSPLNLLFIFALLPQFVNVAALDVASILLAAIAVLIGGAVPLLLACAFAARVQHISRWSARHISRFCGGMLLGFAGLAAIAPG